jgi:hypothetical protein
MIETAHEFGFSPLLGYPDFHWVSAITPNFQAPLEASALLGVNIGKCIATARPARPVPLYFRKSLLLILFIFFSLSLLTVIIG